VSELATVLMLQGYVDASGYRCRAGLRYSLPSATAEQLIAAGVAITYTGIDVSEEQPVIQVRQPEDT
jgi:hypothetical protein